MARSNAYLALLSFIFTGGSIVLLFFVILSGVKDTSPLNRTYFLSADTDGITGARQVSQWAYFYICSPGNVDCSGAWPAPPLGWAWSAKPENAPAQLIGSYGGNTTSYYFFYLWRFGWVFYLITLIFSIVAFFASIIACCGRLGSAIAGLAALVALAFHSVAVSLMTASFVQMRNAFHSAGRDASLGAYGFGFSWGSWAALFIATVLLCMGIRGEGGSGRGFRLGRKRSVRSRRSYDLGSRRVKDDYA
ncbi:SUR7 protein [Biscogniauxia mediterranea]|nr:SUR7 protein [Biscogniauxia mediterranea]